MNRPVTTLFMLRSVDGKVSTGATDNLDVEEILICRNEVRKKFENLKYIVRTQKENYNTIS